MENLLVICEPQYDDQNKCSVNLAMNEILREYSKFFDKVHCFCPGKIKVEGEIGKNNIIYHVTNRYGNNRYEKLLYQFRADTGFLKKIIKDNNITYIQFRIPSFFSLPLYNSVRHLKLKKTTYIAGDVSQSISYIFNKVPFIKTIAKMVDRTQRNIIRDTLVVTTGPVLKAKYKFLNPNIHSFFSTTHNEIKKKSPEMIHSEVFRIVFLGRIDPAKRIEDLLEACYLLKEENYAFTLTVIGDGGHLKYIKRLASELKIDCNIDFKGYVGERLLIDEVLLNSDVIVLPSLTEGTPKVLPEAMSRGVIPIAVRDVGSNNYIIEDRVNGFLVPSLSPRAIYETFKYLISNPVEKIDLIKNAYKYADDRTAEKEIEKIWKFIFTNS